VSSSSRGPKGCFRDGWELWDCWVLDGRTCEYFERFVLTKDHFRVEGFLSNEVAARLYCDTCRPRSARKRINPALLSFIKGSSNPNDRTPGCSRFGFCDCRILGGERCGYFEKAVLPTSVESGTKAKIYDLYMTQTDYVPEAKAKVRLCSCGNEREKNKQFCVACRAKRRRDSDRNRKKRKRVKSDG